MAQDTRRGILTGMRTSSFLFLLFVAMPIAEIALFLRVSESVGWGSTILFVIMTALIGAALVSRQSRGAWRKVQATFAQGEIPTKEITHGGMILVSGALLVTPGFITDTIGFLLLVPGVREVLRRLGARMLKDRFEVRTIGGPFAQPGNPFGGVRPEDESDGGPPDVIDL
ncbi:FxsA protein [hydrothermal vent metagenome]|uniref:FxsA protein n=1 Tax=hydrothermal vent metagenome TaxID=652676 RepID=A0A3B0SU68_9ZZZZ